MLKVQVRMQRENLDPLMLSQRRGSALSMLSLGEVVAEQPVGGKSDGRDLQLTRCLGEAASRPCQSKRRLGRLFAER